MSRYPFMAAANTFLDSYFGVYSPTMYEELLRRYPKIQKQLLILVEQGKIGTTNPSDLTPNDIKEFVISQKTKGLKEVSISHDLSAVKNLCLFINGNNCVDVAKTQFPTLFMKKRFVRLPVVEKPQYNKIIGYINNLSPNAPERLIRAAGIVGLAFGTGPRTSELLYSKIQYLDSELRFVYYDQVKGHKTYGEPRTVPIRPEVLPAIRLYLENRNSDSEYLFPNSSGEPFVAQTFRIDKSYIVEGSGVDFDFRMARRTYAQYMIDEGFPLEEVSIILGHSDTKTTERSYGRPRNDRVVRKVIDFWSKQ